MLIIKKNIIKQVLFNLKNIKNNQVMNRIDLIILEKQFVNYIFIKFLIIKQVVLKKQLLII